MKPQQRIAELRAAHRRWRTKQDRIAAIIARVDAQMGAPQDVELSDLEGASLATVVARGCQ